MNNFSKDEAYVAFDKYGCIEGLCLTEAEDAGIWVEEMKSEGFTVEIRSAVAAKQAFLADHRAFARRVFYRVLPAAAWAIHLLSLIILITAKLIQDAAAGPAWYLYLAMGIQCLYTWELNSSHRKLLGPVEIRFLGVIMIGLASGYIYQASWFLDGLL